MNMISKEPNIQINQRLKPHFLCKLISLKLNKELNKDFGKTFSHSFTEDAVATSSLAVKVCL